MDQLYPAITISQKIHNTDRMVLLGFCGQWVSGPTFLNFTAHADSLTRLAIITLYDLASRTLLCPCPKRLIPHHELSVLTDIKQRKSDLV